MICSCKRVISLGKLINQVLGNNFLRNYNPRTMEGTNEEVLNQSMSETQESLHNDVQRLRHYVETCIKSHSLDSERVITHLCILDVVFLVTQIAKINSKLHYLSYLQYKM